MAEADTSLPSYPKDTYALIFPMKGRPPEPRGGVAKLNGDRPDTSVACPAGSFVHPPRNPPLGGQRPHAPTRGTKTSRQGSPRRHHPTHRGRRLSAIRRRPWPPATTPRTTDEAQPSALPRPQRWRRPLLRTEPGKPGRRVRWPPQRSARPHPRAPRFPSPAHAARMRAADRTAGSKADVGPARHRQPPGRTTGTAGDGCDASHG